MGECDERVQTLLRGQAEHICREEMITNEMNGPGKTKKASTENKLDVGECDERVSDLLVDQTEQDC